MNSLRFTVAVIMYNPNMDVLNRINVYSKCFEKVMVLDNSEQKNTKLISEINDLKNIDYIDMHGNEGISKALNIALKIAVNEEYDYVLTMDQDTDFSSKSITYMQEVISKNKRNDVAIYAPNFRKKYYKEQTVVYKTSTYDTNTNIEIESCMTSGSFISCGVLKEIIPLENYFIAHVDTDLSALVRMNGYKIMLVGSVIFDQQLGKPMNASWFNMKFNATNHEPIRYYYMIRNYFYFRKKYKNFRKVKKQLLIMPIKYVFKLITSETNKIDKIKYAYEGYQDYKKGVYGKYSK